MTTFGWKRKAGAKVSKQSTQAFAADAKDEDSELDETYDWLTLAPRKVALSLEDPNAKCERLKVEGATLAETERYWEAMKKWEEALELVPHNYKVLDMKAQALMAVGEVFPAVKVAERTVSVAPTWWPGHQTLGRALASVGEVRMALKSFCRAVHLSPGEEELWTEDLMWAKSLLDRHRDAQKQKEQAQHTHQAEGGSTLTVKELDCSDNEESDVPQPVIQYTGSGGVEDGGTVKQNHCCHKKVKRLPKNYVQMRDPS